MLILKNRRKFSKITLTDEAGNSETFESIDEVAKYCEVKPVSVYNAIRRKYKIRGCKIVAEV